ncbi:MAG: hypothetical protein ACFFB5_22585 [Promethearchaeota archaeon]
MSGKEFIGSIAVSLLAIGAITLFVLPQLYPVIQAGTDDTQTDISSLKSDVEEIQSDITDLQSESNGILLQTKKLVTNDHAEITEEDTTLQLMNNTSLVITVQQGSRLNARFSGVFRLAMKSLEVKHADYKITLMLQGVTGQTTHISYWDYQGTTTNSLYLTYSVYIELLTDSLDAGTYTIAVWWQSLEDYHPSDPLIYSRLYASDIDNVVQYNVYSRTIIVQELSA